MIQLFPRKDHLFFNQLQSKSVMFMCISILTWYKVPQTLYIFQSFGIISLPIFYQIH